MEDYPNFLLNTLKAGLRSTAKAEKVLGEVWIQLQGKEQRLAKMSQSEARGFVMRVARRHLRRIETEEKDLFDRPRPGRGPVQAIDITEVEL